MFLNKARSPCLGHWLIQYRAVLRERGRLPLWPPSRGVLWLMPVCFVAVMVTASVGHCPAELPSNSEWAVLPEECSWLSQLPQSRHSFFQSHRGLLIRYWKPRLVGCRKVLKPVSSDARPLTRRVVLTSLQFHLSGDKGTRTIACQLGCVWSWAWSPAVVPGALGMWTAWNLRIPEIQSNAFSQSWSCNTGAVCRLLQSPLCGHSWILSCSVLG